MVYLRWRRTGFILPRIQLGRAFLIRLTHFWGGFDRIKRSEISQCTHMPRVLDVLGELFILARATLSAHLKFNPNSPLNQLSFQTLATITIRKISDAKERGDEASKEVLEGVAETLAAAWDDGGM